MRTVKAKGGVQAVVRVTVEIEGATFISTDYADVLVKPETEAWFRAHYSGKGLMAHNVRRRADAALVAMATFLSEDAWRRGKQLEEI